VERHRPIKQVILIFTMLKPALTMNKEQKVKGGGRGGVERCGPIEEIIVLLTPAFNCVIVPA
jgi:hypothetical protein